jgi:hypothetical protein
MAIVFLSVCMIFLKGGFLGFYFFYFYALYSTLIFTGGVFGDLLTAS